MGLKFFSIDSESVATAPSTNRLLDLPCAGAPILIANRECQVGIHQILEVDEREEFLRRFYQATSHFKCGGHAVGVCLYIFGISINQWLSFEGQIRKALFLHKPKDTPNLVPGGQKIYDLPPRDSSTRAAWQFIRGRLEQDERYSWLNAKDFSKIGSMTNMWYEEFWKQILTEQSKIVSDNAQDINADGKGRMDQVVTFDLARSCVGERVLDRAFDADGKVKHFGITNIKASLIPKPWKRPALHRLNIRILLRYTSEDLAFRYQRNHNDEVVLDEHGEEIAIDRSPIARSCSITYKLLDQIKIPGDDKAGLLEKLKYALQIDMDVDFNEDELEVAWQNPNNFWGHKEMMCRIRTDVEMSKILEFLRVAHLVEPENESTVFLFLCPRTAVAKDYEHPPWPAAYPVEIEMKVAKTAKRKAAVEHTVVSPRKKVCQF